MARIVVTFEAPYNHKAKKHEAPRVQEYQGIVYPSFKDFDYWRIVKDDGGTIYIKDYEVVTVETFVEEEGA